MLGKYQILLRPWFGLATLALPAGAAPTAGGTLYLEKCAMCHLPEGQGAAPAFPPLAGSDWLLADRARTIRVVCEGLEGPIKVNGQLYHNVMPAQVLNDAEVAEVLTYVTNAWGNQAAPFTSEEVKQARAGTRFATFAELEKAAAYAPLPTPPAGWTVKEAASLPAFCTRLAGDGKGGPVLVLGERGTVYRMENGTVVPWILAGSYAELAKGTITTMGMTLGPDGRLWVISNRKVVGHEGIDVNEVTLWRSGPVQGDQAPVLKPWLETSYPWGVGPYNHGVSHLAFGPDGMLYVSSGSRTDGGEEGTSEHIARTGETPVTAALWRLDPQAESPKIEVIASGIRNAYGFAWNAQGQLFAVSNGPDADAPEELDVVTPGHHYGFPYQFSDWPRSARPYPHTPTPPEGLAFTYPVRNNGPAAGGGVPGGLATFDPHSSPAGMIWCGPEFPEPLRGGFLVARYGNLLPTPQDAGFDLLRVVPEQEKDTGLWRAEVTTVLAPLGRPIDVLPDGKGGVFILEYTRPTNFKSRVGWLPGRVLQLSPAGK